MLTNYTLTSGQWKKISLVGESGAVWLKSANGFRPNIKISHTVTAQTPSDNIPYASGVNLDIDVAYSLPQHEVSEELSADSGSDIFYATVVNPGKTCIITTDFVIL